MKFVLGIFLFAFVTTLRADDFEDIFLDDGGEPIRHPYVVRKKGFFFLSAFST